ncbi:hypothetical protein ACIPIN_12840 [Pseudomonas sp. NPDC087697]|uniref:hypothetical protein n=1 Tax=Pseudomonas sp. NPDC087697 TaxID=3364447 RepID=UPI00381F882C
MSMVDFSSAQLLELKRLFDGKDYPGAYGYMHGVVAEKIAVAGKGEDVTQLQVVANWLITAKAINSNDRGNFLGDIVRGSIKFAVATTELKGADLFLGLNLISENKSVPFVIMSGYVNNAS